jgi:hypothetical protein
MNKKLDNMIEKNVYETKKICEMEHSKLIDLLNQKFNDVQLKFEPLLREPKFYQNFEVYDMASTTPTASGSSTPRSSSRTSSSSTIKSKSIVYENNEKNIYAGHIYGEGNEESLPLMTSNMPLMTSNISTFKSRHANQSSENESKEDSTPRRGVESSTHSQSRS